jgi:Ser/Thr protein kinase RdoA (MazF antagonist)
MEQSIPFVLSQYGLDQHSYHWSRFGKGHIHSTYKVEGRESFILQQFNDRVFTRPEIVERNIRLTGEYLAQQSPEYLFVSPITAQNGRDMVYDKQAKPWRLFPFITNSYSLDEASTLDQAYRASAAFGKVGRLLKNCSTAGFEPTIERFHDLSFRFEQFEDSLRQASGDRRGEASQVIEQAKQCKAIVSKYEALIAGGVLTRRIFHNDTKINNVLFDHTTHEVAAVVDLDTLMPGYFIYDLGDLLRTIVSPVSEEEADMEKVSFRRNFYDAVTEGYLSEMSDTLTADEKQHVTFAGQMMTCIMALRFLADYLRGDTYYHITYPGQNLVRARNQFRLLELLTSNT